MFRRPVENRVVHIDYLSADTSPGGHVTGVTRIRVRQQCSVVRVLAATNDDASCWRVRQILKYSHAMLAEISRFAAEIGEIFLFDSCATRRLSVLWLSMVSVGNLKSTGRSKAPIGVTAKLA